MNLKSTLIATVILVAINLVAWTYLNQPKQAETWEKQTLGLSFSPMRRHHNPEKGRYPNEKEIDADLALLTGKAHAIRTYSVTNGQELIPGLASKHGLNVTAGAWIQANTTESQKEIDNLLMLLQGNKNIIRALVGNETLVRNEMTVNELIGYIRQVRGQTNVPVSTSETWDKWMKHPELANEVDFIATHILPYWEGVPFEEALDYVFDRYHALQKAFPNKQIVLTEVGWPSSGQPIRQSIASLDHQAKFLREFLNRAHEEGIVYYVVEAFDQPWKSSIEGTSGAYWGLYDVDRKPKFSFTGKILAKPAWKSWAGGAAALSVFIMLVFLVTRPQLKINGKLFFGIVANLSASTIAWTASTGAEQYHSGLSILMWVILLSMQALALLILIIDTLEVAEVIWNKKSLRNFQPLDPSPDYPFPKVSIHIPIHNEPPKMVRKTLAALTQLDYPNFEVLVLDNNTSDSKVWEPVARDCKRFGNKFKFFHLENWPGFKAGALNYGIQQTAEDAEIIAVIDSDYTVDRDWLKRLTPYFEKPNVGFVQSPQNYRDDQENWFKSLCHWEYRGFFKIGMVQRNEHNAIIQHGTMTMIRKSALEKVGNWGEWCICEDSELGVRLYREGYDSVYVPDIFGKGLTPDNLSSYMSQRYRWVYGAMQILKKHWRGFFLPYQQSGLTPAQRYHFVAGWLPWISDAVALFFTIGSLLLTARILIDPIHGELPVAAFIVPSIGLFAFKVIRSFWLYKVRVECTFWQTCLAAIAGLALTHTVAKAAIQGLFTSSCPFLRTPKCESKSPIWVGLMMIKQELIMLFLLLTAALIMNYLEHFDNLTGNLWVTILLVQATPYAATLFTLLINVMPDFSKVTWPSTTVNAAEK